MCPESPPSADAVPTNPPSTTVPSKVASPEVNFYNSTVIDWKEPTVEMYDVERVPSFVVNRRFMVSLDTSDKKTVEYALGLISSLARGR